MRIHAVLVAALLVVAIAIVPGTSEAVSIQVWADGVQIPSGGPGTDSVTLASGSTWTTYGNIKIRGRNGSGDVKVIAGDGSTGGKDDAEDELKFINAEIKRANTGVPTDNTEYHIIFEGTFNNSPTTDTGQFSYELTGGGDIRTTAGNYVKATGLIESPTGTWTSIGQLTHTVSAVSYNFFNSPYDMVWGNFPNPTVNTARKLKVDVAFKLQKTTDALKIAAGTGIMLQDAPAHGPRRPPERLEQIQERLDKLEDLMKYILGAEKIKQLLPPKPGPAPIEKSMKGQMPATKK